MKNHNYLRAVAWDFANKADAKAERSAVSSQRAAKADPDPSDPSPGSDRSEPSLSPEEVEKNRQAFLAATARFAKQVAMPAGPKKAAQEPPRALNLVPCDECSACRAGVPAKCTDRRLP
jgi:hypothetical protein